jgi:hypothetical protein
MTAKHTQPAGTHGAKAPAAPPASAALAAEGAGGGPPDSGPLQIWNDVPDRFTLVLTVSSTDAGFAASARMASNDGRNELWPDSEIHPGPKRRLLSQTAQGYVVNVFVAFDTTDPITAEIRAHIEDPDGNPFKDEYVHSVSGKRGDIEHATLVVNMVEP